MDKEWPEERRRRFVAVAARHPEARGIHDLRTRSSGTHEFAQFHIWVDPAMSVAGAHDVIDAIEAELAREFPGVEILIHLDPEGQVDQPDNPLAERDETEGLPRMTELRIVQVDAFADRPFTGNPAAVMPLEAWLPDETLQAIAMENNLSETAFTIPARRRRRFRAALVHADDRSRALRPCHAGERPCPDRRAATAIRFRTRRAGMLEVARDGDGYAMSLPAWKPEPKPLPRIVEALGCDAGRDALASASLRAGRRSAREAEVLRAPARLPEAGRRRRHPHHRHRARRATTDVVSRVFATGAGIDEDPVTGSAHAVLIPYWAERLGRDHLTAWQASQRGGRLTGRLAAIASFSAAVA